MKNILTAWRCHNHVSLKGWSSQIIRWLTWFCPWWPKRLVLATANSSTSGQKNNRSSVLFCFQVNLFMKLRSAACSGLPSSIRVIFAFLNVSLNLWQACSACRISFPITGFHEALDNLQSLIYFLEPNQICTSQLCCYLVSCSVLHFTAWSAQTFSPRGPK